MAGPASDVAMAAWSVAVDGDRVRRAGRWLLWVGSAAMLCGMFLTPPWGLFGLAAAALGEIGRASCRERV